MAVATKGRRKIKVGDRDFIWYISDDYDSADLVLHVASYDKKIIIKYHLHQPDETRFLIVLGKEFNGLLNAGGSWIRVLCPKFEKDSVITPASVRMLVDWCLSDKSELVEVDWLGNPIN